MGKKIRPANGYLLIEPLKNEGNVLIAEEGNEEPEVGKVIAKGGQFYKNEHGVTFENDAEVGDILIYKKYSDQKIDIDGEKYILIKITDVIGVVKNEK